MNCKRRNNLKKAIELLNKVTDVISFVCDEESDSLENMPENLLSSDRCQKMEDNIDELYDIESDIGTIIQRIESIVG